MAEATTKVLSLAEQYVLDKVKPDAGSEPVEPTKAENPESPPPVEEKLVESPSVEEANKVPPVAPAESTEEVTNAVDETPEAAPEDSVEIPETAPKDSRETSEEEAPANEADEEPEEKEIVLSTAPADYRFPTTNQSRHCFTRYIEYHRYDIHCPAKGEGASECDKFAKYYRALCPGEWVDRWNEQRENGTFPGPL